MLERDGDKTVTLKLKDLEQRAWSLEECLMMLREAKEGEQQLANRSGLHDEFRTALGLDVVTSKQAGQSTKSSSQASGKKASSVGKPLPRRLTVGVDQNASAANYKFCNIDNMSISLKRTRCPHHRLQN